MPTKAPARVPTRPKRVVHQKRKGPIDPIFGERIRQLRIARGLTQSQLAGQDFSNGFISLLETGRTRASVRASGILANRLGVSLAEIVATPDPATADAVVTLTRAEGRLTVGDLDETMRLIASVERRLTGLDSAKAKRLKGQVLAARRSPEAITVLDDALRAYRAAGDREAVARTLFEMAMAHARLEQQGEALNLGLQSEQLVTEGAVVDRTFELRLMSFLASILVNLADYGAAELRTERAKALAEDVADPRATADLYENLAATRQRQGDLEAALTYARRSLGAYESIGNVAQVGSSWNTIGWVYIQRGQHTRAAEALDRAERVALEIGDRRLMGYVLQNRAELALAAGDVPAAIAAADASIAEPQASTRCRAISRLVRARALAQGTAKDTEVIENFELAFEALAPHGRRMLARAYQAYFDALSARGRIDEANRAARRALELLAPSLE